MKNLRKKLYKITLLAAFAGLTASNSSQAMFSRLWRSITPNIIKTYFNSTKTFKSEITKQTFKNIKNNSKKAFKKAKKYKKPLLTAGAIGGGAYGAHQALQFLNKQTRVYAEKQDNYNNHQLKFLSYDKERDYNHIIEFFKNNQKSFGGVSGDRALNDEYIDYGSNQKIICLYVKNEFCGFLLF